MVAGARRTEGDDKGGEWRPVPLVLPGEGHGPGRCLDALTSPGQSLQITMAETGKSTGRAASGVQTEGCYSVYLFIWQPPFNWGHKIRSKNLDSSLSSTSQSFTGEGVCVSLFSWLALSFPAGEYHEIINRRLLWHLIPFPLIHQCSHYYRSKLPRDLGKKSVDCNGLYTLNALPTGRGFLSSLVIWVAQKPADVLWGGGRTLFWLSASPGGTRSESKSLAEGGVFRSGNTFHQAMFGCDASLCGCNMDSTAWLYSPGIQIVLEGKGK